MFLTVANFVGILRSHLNVTWRLYIYLDIFIHQLVNSSFTRHYDPGIIVDLMNIRDSYLGYLNFHAMLEQCFASILNGF